MEVCCQLHTSATFPRKETKYRLCGRQTLSGRLKSLLPLPRFLLVEATSSSNSSGSTSKSHCVAYIFMSRFLLVLHVHSLLSYVAPPPLKDRPIIFCQAYACSFELIYRRLSAIVDEVCKWRPITFNWILLMVLLLSVWTFFFSNYRHVNCILSGVF